MYQRWLIEPPGRHASSTTTLKILAKGAKAAKEVEEAAKVAKLAKETAEAAKLKKAQDAAAKLKRAEEKAAAGGKGGGGAKVKGKGKRKPNSCLTENPIFQAPSVRYQSLIGCWASLAMLMRGTVEQP